MKLIKDALFGLAVGDALGVPVEFESRYVLEQHPVTDMVGYGTHNQPPGTWSDDSSLSFCLAEALTQDFDLAVVSENCKKWLYLNDWTPWGEVFDVGMATRRAIQRLVIGTPPTLAGGFEENDNGNGSLMRILPLVFYIKDKEIQERYLITKEVSSITHAHVRSVVACFYYLEFARLLLEGNDKLAIFRSLQTSIPPFLQSLQINPAEVALYDRLLKEDIYTLPADAISSSGYVLHTLEASIWCLLTTSSYKEAVLKAVNLGGDTDTTGAVTGGLAALLYGYDNIPASWINQLARKDDIEQLANRMVKRFFIE